MHTRIQDSGLEKKDFKAFRVSLASPEQIRNWSYGEVTKPETINYRRLRPEKDGLFCEAIFGPTRDWQCYCGKYKNVRYRGIVCDKCGVEVTKASVRRERMGHIELAAPVAHVWYTRRVPSHLGLLLDISRRNLDRVLYFAQYVITHVDEDARQKAIKRLEEKMLAEIAEVRGSADGQIAEIRTIRDSALTEIESENSSIIASYDSELASRTDEVMRVAQRIQHQLEDHLNLPAESDIKFFDEVIASSGELVTNSHIAKIQKAAELLLNDIVNEIDGLKTDDLGKKSGSPEALKLEAASRIDQYEDAVSSRINEIAQNYAHLRSELEDLHRLQFLGEPQYRELRQKYGQVFRAKMGADAFYEVLKDVDLEKLRSELRTEVKVTRSKQRKRKATKRLRVVESLLASNNKPEWMILTVLPVIPPDLRPMVQLDGGRFATSDLNDLYRRVINRNNRLKRLLDLGAPDVIVRNEKRMLQEAVDSLIDNSQRGRALSRRGRRELKSLSDMLKGKKGRFRRNLLGKRVDYSGRSVIVIGPKLKLYQCGLPKTMALELYRPFVISRLVKNKHAANVKGAKRMIDQEKSEVFEALEEVIKERPVLLNRAPTLHRLGIQAFEPTLVEGKAIQIHPLVCTAFNADFDGDQMAVHVPLSDKAVKEARELMLSSKNLLKPSDGEPIVGPSKDMVLGIYYLTMEKPGHRIEDVDPHSIRTFYDIDEVELAVTLGQIHLHTPVRIYQIFDEPIESYAGTPIMTTAGRCIFNRIVPDNMRWVNETLGKREINKLVSKVYSKNGSDKTVEFVDEIKNLGFLYATLSGASIAVSDLTVPDERAVILEAAENRVNDIDRDFRRGLLTEDERYQNTIEIWNKAKSDVETAVKGAMDQYNSVFIMADSGSTKGGMGPITQLAGMRGLMADPSGRIIDLPIRSNFREGLTALEYFISTHGARKGLADTALRTAEAGYLTRRLVDVAQDVIINKEDCGTNKGIWIRRSEPIAGQTVTERIFGRVAAGPVIHPQTGEIIVDRDEIIDEEIAEMIDQVKVEDIFVRSPMTCELTQGICAKCYGRDLGRGRLVDIGTAVGTIAAQSIGEPGTQLTLRTFHTGGTAQKADITQGLPRVEELFEARKKPKGEAVITDIDGVVSIYMKDEVRIVKVRDSQVMQEAFDMAGWELAVEDGDEITLGMEIARKGEETFVSEHEGHVELSGSILTMYFDQIDEREYEIPSASRLIQIVDDEGDKHTLSNGDMVKAGDQLTEGAKNPHRILRILGAEATQKYLLTEVQEMYRSQGVNISDKHFEVIIRKLLSRVQITRSGDTPLLPGERIDRLELRRINEKIIAEGGQPAVGQNILLGITKAALETDSFLAAASFQHTIRVLASAAVAGKTDPLIGLKENVIIGKLIPAGTGFDHYRAIEAAKEEQRLLAEGVDLDKLSIEPGLEDLDDEEEDIDDLEEDLEDILDSVDEDEDEEEVEEEDEFLDEEDFEEEDEEDEEDALLDDDEDFDDISEYDDTFDD